MPRRRPLSARELLQHPAYQFSVVRGMSSRLLADIRRLEETQQDFRPRSVESALRLWTRHLGSPYRHLRDFDSGMKCGVYECCGGSWRRPPNSTPPNPMPRRRPVPPRGRLQPFHGASTRLLADLHRHGGALALEEWSMFVRNPHHRRWLRHHEDNPDHQVADALWAREGLEHTIRKLPRRAARELRELVNRLDDLC